MTTDDQKFLEIYRAATTIYAGYAYPHSSKETRAQAVHEAFEFWQLVQDYPDVLPTSGERQFSP